MNLSCRAALNCNKLIKHLTPMLSSKRNSYKIITRPDIIKLKNPKTSEKEGGYTLSTLINQKIKLSGPITVADYMREVLTNPAGGYYMKKDVFGERGDFITSPEVSQLFGEILGVWLMMEWNKLSAPKPLQIVELGPGRGTLLADILRVTKKVGLNKKNLTLHLVEVSPAMRLLQANQLCMEHGTVESQPYCYEGDTVSGIKVYWYKDLSDVPKQFSLIIAHEFFDALPIHKFKKTEEGWREILIDIDSSNKSANADDSKYRYVLSRNETVASKLYVQAALGDSKMDQLEVCPQALVIMKQLASRVEEFGGIALITDYGHDGSKGDTFRAFKKHAQTDPLAEIGTADLTADVDFSQLKRVVEEAKVLGPITQKQFLESTHAHDRLKALLEKASDDQKDNLESGYELLTDPQKMGEVFKFMAVFPSISEEHYKKYPVSGFTQ